MVFTSPAWTPQLLEIPDSITVEEFMNNEKYGRYPLNKARNAYTCGITGRTYAAAEVVERTTNLARAIAEKLGFDPDEGTEWDRVVYLYSVNTVDYISLIHAIHRLSSIVTLASAAYTPEEVEHQLRSVQPKAIFTCTPLLDNALKAAKAIGLPSDRIFLLPVPGVRNEPHFETIEDLVDQGKRLPPLRPLKWVKGQGLRQTAILSFSSGTSGLPKTVKISHYNVIADALQISLYESVGRKKLGVEAQVTLGVLPLSHIYGIYIAMVSYFRGDELVILPKYELSSVLQATQRFRIEMLPVVPPMIIHLLNSKETVAKYDLSSVRAIQSGAAPLGSETLHDLLELFPRWHFGQAYGEDVFRGIKSFHDFTLLNAEAELDRNLGITECAPLISATCETDPLDGSSGSLLPGILAKVVDAEGKEVTAYETPGELYIQSPSVTLGYLNNEKATAETFVWDADGRWLRTGDEVLFRKSPKGHEHIFVIDRIKELIKTKGHQVAPAELEAHLLLHEYVGDCAVIQVPDAFAGEVPKAFVTKSRAADGKSDETIASALQKHVEDHKAKHKWLVGGVEFIEAIPKTPSGKIVRRLLRDKEREARKRAGAKL